MAYVKKISNDQFLLDCINTEYAIINSPIHFLTFEELLAYTKKHPKWYNTSSFKTEAQYLAWKDYFYNHFYDWQPKSVSKVTRAREFSWFDLCFGFKQDF